MLSLLFVTQTVEAIDEALRSAGVGAGKGRVAVIGPPRVKRALAGRGHEVVSLPAEEGSLAGVVGFGAGARADWEALLADWIRGLGDGGALVLVDRAKATELSRRALCGGLAEIQQRRSGRTWVTSGLVTRVP
jgi:hypothetical protein